MTCTVDRFLTVRDALEFPLIVCSHDHETEELTITDMFMMSCGLNQGGITTAVKAIAGDQTRLKEFTQRTTVKFVFPSGQACFPSRSKLCK